MGKLIPRLIGEDVELVLHTSPDLGTIRADVSQIEQNHHESGVVKRARRDAQRRRKLLIETSNEELDSV